MVAIEYYNRSKKVFDNIKEYEALKCNVFYCLTLSNIALGRLQKAEENIKIMENMFSNILSESADIITLYFAKARLFFIQGKYVAALEQADKTIETLLRNGAHSKDLFFTNYYMLRSEILNFLGKYQEAYEQANNYII